MFMYLFLKKKKNRCPNGLICIILENTQKVKKHNFINVVAVKSF